MFRPWGPLLPDTIEVIAIQYPGRHDRMTDPFVAELRELAETIAADLPQDGRLLFFGHSMGAVLAYELARLVPPHHLFVSAPPSDRSRRDYADDADLLAAVRALGGSGVAPLDNPVIQELALPGIRHDFAMLARYRAAGAGHHMLSCPISVLAARDDPICPPGSTEVWRHRTSAAFDLQVFPGGHHYLEQQQNEVLSYVTEQMTAYALG